MFEHGEAVTWHRFSEGTEDDYGNITPGGFADESITAGFAPESTEESGTGRVVSDAKLYLSDAIPYQARDEFTARGVRYGVRGDGQGGWVNPFTGSAFGQEILLRRVTG